MMHHKKLSTTIGANSYTYLHKMVKTGKAESLGQVVHRAVEVTRRLDNRTTLDRKTDRYFRSLKTGVAAEEVDLENAMSAVSQELDFDQP